MSPGDRITEARAALSMTWRHATSTRRAAATRYAWTGTLAACLDTWEILSRRLDFAGLIH